MEHLWYSFSRNGDFLQLAVVFMCNWNFSWPLADDWLSHIVTSDPVLHLHQPLPVYLNIPHSPLVISRTWPRSPFSSLQLPFRHFPLCNCHHSSSLVFFPSPSLSLCFCSCQVQTCRGLDCLPTAFESQALDLSHTWCCPGWCSASLSAFHRLHLPEVL